MKKFLLVVVTILPTLLAAQNGIVISNFSVSGGTITLDISWKKTGMPTLWLDSAWVFVDYNNAGVMERLPLAAGATLTATSAPGVGKVITVSGNNQGVWVVGNAKVATAGSFSATVKLPFVGSNVSGACAYASNYPPLGTWNNDMNRLSIVGTPPYTLTLQLKSSAATETVISGSPFILSPDYTLVAFTDKTGALGLFNCTPPTAPTSLTASSATICDGTSVTLTATGGSDGSGAQFEWGTGTVGIGGTLTSSNTYSVSPTSTTTYWIRRVSTDNCGTSTAITRTVTVITKPSVPIPTIGGNTCVGTGLTFSATTPGGATGVEWTGAVTGTGSPKTTATTAGTYSAQVRSYLTVGTLTCTSAYSNATSATVVAAPSVPTPSVGGNTCVGTGITFSATTPGGATGVEWTGAVTGTGSPKTTATTAGTYSAQVRSYLTVGTLTCTSAYSTATSGTVNALPTPSFADGKTQGCAGSVVAVTASGGGSYCFALTNTTCNPINTTATYDVPMPQAGNQAIYVTVKNVAGCTATINKTLTGLPVPAINYLSGNTYQTVASGTAIAAIKYTTTGATTVTAANLPTGITANWASNTVTISGTSSITGAKSYTVTASNSNGCANATASGTITIANPVYPPGAGTQTWTCGTQTWSAAVKIPACSGTAFTVSSNVAYCRNANDFTDAGYFYNWAYVNQYASTLCPDPWRLPSIDDYKTLFIFYGSTNGGESGADSQLAAFVACWKPIRAGVLRNGNILGVSATAAYATSEIRNSGYFVEVDVYSTWFRLYDEPLSSAAQVRCVR